MAKITDYERILLKKQATRRKAIEKLNITISGKTLGAHKPCANMHCSHLHFVNSFLNLPNPIVQVESQKVEAFDHMTMGVVIVGGHVIVLPEEVTVCGLTGMLVATDIILRNGPAILLF